MCSFSYDQFFLSSLILLTLLSARPAWAQNLNPQENYKKEAEAASHTAPAAPSSDNSEPASESEPVLPRTSDPLPPTLPERKVPVPPLVSAPPFGISNPSKPSLAWRQKAARLAMEKFKTGSTASSPLIRSFDSNYSDCLTALATSCASNGFKVEYINSNAGEVLASNSEGQNRLVFTVWEQADGKVWINGGIDRGNASFLSKSASAILDTTGATVSRRGRI